MSRPRFEESLNWAATGGSLLGLITQEQLVGLASFFANLLLTLWNRRSAAGTGGLDPETEYWKKQAFKLDRELDDLKRSVERLESGHEPVAITPPFPPGEACSGNHEIEEQGSD